jgi:hypothetical protein
MPTVYLLHFDPPYRHMKHYIGATERRVVERLGEHRMGIGGRTTRLAVEAGCKLELARIWENVPWSFERELKGRGAKELCPICNPRPPKAG